MNELFNIENFNIIEDEENYYFFRSLEPGDIQDIENGIITTDKGYKRLRTDRERWEEQHTGNNPRWNSKSNVSLEEMFNHIKMHYSLETNCISLSSNANIARTYGEKFSENYVMIKVPKKEMEQRVFNAGQYMLQEINERVNEALKTIEIPQHIKDDINKIDESTTTSEIKEIIKMRYKSDAELDVSRAGLRHGIVYRSPHARISSYQSLNEEQLLEKNKIIAKLTILEQKANMKPLMTNANNNNLLIQTVGNAFASSEQIYYGDIEGERVQNISKELLDIFGLLQQVEGRYEEEIKELKRELIKFVYSGQNLNVTEKSYLNRTDIIKDDISIEEMYELTGGKVEYGMANSIVKKMFYLSKSQLQARGLSKILRTITGNNPRYEDVIKYIEKNGFEIEPEITTRQSNRGYRISESVNLDLGKNELELIERIKSLTDEEQIKVLENGGLSNVKNIITSNFSKIQQSKISKEKYYAEAIFSLYKWEEIGIEEFTISEKNNFIERLQDNYCMDLYKLLQNRGIERKNIPYILLNIITRKNNYEIEENDTLESIKSKRIAQYENLINDHLSELIENISIERVERFLGYYDVENTGIRLKPYQQRALRIANELFKDEKFAQIVLPTGAGKTFIALAKLQEYAKQHPNEKILYLAPQNEIINQVKKDIIKYMHGKRNTVGKQEEEIIAEVFPDITFETYPGLLSKKNQELINTQYGIIVLDELHRTGAKEWETKVDSLFENQDDRVKVLGITATPERDSDGKDMAEITARKLGYEEEKLKQRKYLASNMTLENAIRMGYVVNPKLVYCKYDLVSSGKIQQLREKIEDIKDERKKKEELEKYNKFLNNLNQEIDEEIGAEARKKLEDDARKNLESGIGKEEILKQNVKKGGKYIVYIPVTDQGDIEDEDGNRIGEKTGEDKIKAYQDYLLRVFENTDIVPQFYSMLGAYGENKNRQELEQFEANDDETKFMVVMNKANEGLHIDGVTGIIWLRALDADSRILYLQQLGRAIYALDEDEILEDADRTLIIDLANNSLTVRMNKSIEKTTLPDDLELFSIVVDWIKEHDGLLPDKDSSSNQEKHYYDILRRIQNKYGKYLDNNEIIIEKDKEEIQKIIELGNEIELWNIDLPPISKSVTNKINFTPFMAEGIIKDFVDLEDDVNDLQNESAMSIFTKVCEALAKQGFYFENFSYGKTVDINGTKKRVFKTLEDVWQEHPEIDINQVLEETGVKLDYSIGDGKVNALAAAKGRGSCLITEDEIKRLLAVKAISLERETSVSKFTRVCESLSRQGMDFQKFKLYKVSYKNGKKVYKKKTLEDIANEYPDIDINQVLEQTGVSINYSFTRGYNTTLHAFSYNSKGNRVPITENEKQRLIKIKVMNLESTVSKFIRVCEALAKQGLDFKSFNYSRSYFKNGKRLRATKKLEDISQEYPEIDIQKIVEETGVPLDYSIGSTKQQIVVSINGNGTLPISDEEKKKLTELGIINEGKKESAIEIFIKVCEALHRQGLNFRDFAYTKSIKQDEKYIHIGKRLDDIAIEYPNIDINRVLEETGVSIDYPMSSGHSITLSAFNNHKGFLTEDERNRLLELGVMVLEKETASAKLVRVCESLKRQGFDFKKCSFNKRIIENGKTRKIYKKLSDIGQEYPEIDIQKIVEETGVSLDYPIGITRKNISSYINKRDQKRVTEIEKYKLIELGVIDKSKNKTGQEIGKASFSIDTEGTKKCDEAQYILEQAIQEQEQIQEGGIIQDDIN